MKYSIEPSALAYLFGDVLEDVFAGVSRFGLSETLPCRGGWRRNGHQLAAAGNLKIPYSMKF